ncbi:hypothetical protein Tco_1428477 [Tanacetum coccineum]
MPASLTASERMTISYLEASNRDYHSVLSDRGVVMFASSRSRASFRRGRSCDVRSGKSLSGQGTCEARSQGSALLSTVNDVALLGGSEYRSNIIRYGIEVVHYDYSTDSGVTEVLLLISYLGHGEGHRGYWRMIVEEFERKEVGDMCNERHDVVEMESVVSGTDNVCGVMQQRAKWSVTSSQMMLIYFGYVWDYSVDYSGGLIGWNGGLVFGMRGYVVFYGEVCGGVWWLGWVGWDFFDESGVGFGGVCGVGRCGEVWYLDSVDFKDVLGCGYFGCGGMDGEDGRGSFGVGWDGCCSETGLVLIDRGGQLFTACLSDVLMLGISGMREYLEQPRWKDLQYLAFTPPEYLRTGRVDPAQALNVPIVPLGAMLTAVYSLTSRPPYSLAWLNHMISTQDIMDPDLLKKLVLKNFCTIPAKLLLQLASAFKERGLSDRSGTFFYQEHIHKINVPILVVASDQDAICPLKLYKLPSQDMAPIGMEDGG